MKTSKLLFTAITAITLLLCGCSIKDKDSSAYLGKEGTGSIYFSGMLKELTKNSRMSLENLDVNIPKCKDNMEPAFVRIALRNIGLETGEMVWVEDNDGDDDYFIDISVVPFSNDSDNNGAPNFLTTESLELELKAGNYSLEYFAVLNSNKEIIMMAPREDGNYGPAQFQNFVNIALPVPIDIKEGTKHYTQLETICYDEKFALAYGYLFFDFERVELTHLCVFGNICDENQKHAPAHFRLKIWEYFLEKGETGRELVNRTNKVDFSSQDTNQLTALPLCVPLPDRQGTDYYFGEIYLIDENGGEQLIREGIFEDTDLLQFYDEIEDVYDYYHFRESCCGYDDNAALLMDIVPEEEDCTVNNPPSSCETAYMFGDTEFYDLELKGNNWGWAEYFELSDLENGIYSSTLYAAAAQNDLNKGFPAGEVHITIEGTNVKVNIQLIEGCTLGNTHVYLSDEVPTKSSPGQYGNTHSNVGGKLNSFHLQYSGDGNFWIIVHVEVCCEID